MFRLLLCLMVTLVPFVGYAQQTISRGEYAKYLAEDLFCSTMQLFSGDIGLLIGLAVSAAGFALILFRGLSMGYILLILVGIFMTAIPGWFQSGINTYSTITSGIGGGKVVITRDDWKGDCKKADAYAPEPLQDNGGDVVTGDGTVGEVGELLGGDGTVTSEFGRRASGDHKGRDIAAARGTPIYSSTDGTVTRSEYSNTYGNVVYVQYEKNGKTYETRYAHMDRRTVTKGTIIKAGSQVGNVGNTGQSRGNHLHYEERINGKAVNPCGSSGFGNTC